MILELLPSGLEDLLNSFHILLCVIDLITEELRQFEPEILNPEFGWFQPINYNFFSRSNGQIRHKIHTRLFVSAV